MDDLAVYIHWPFCLDKCPYCDFNSHVADTIDHDAWRHAYGQEISYWAIRTGERKVKSIFFGGGTPSLMEPETVGACLAAVGVHWAIDSDVEVTLEANPTSVEADKLAAFRDAGVNRLSLGVQALDTEALAFLDRRHALAETRAAIETAAATFPNWSMDMIYCRPDQSVDDWLTELDDALSYAPSHLSAYQLTIEKGTRFYTEHKSGAFVLPDEGIQADLYEATNARLEAAGLSRYEVSNHARPGRRSLHNLAYWRGREYVGIGPGAHGRPVLKGKVHASRQIASPQGWRAAVEQNGHATQEDVALDVRALRNETAMMGLRLVDGIRKAEFAARTGLAFDEAFCDGCLPALQAEGLLIVDDETVRPTTAGLARLNAVLRFLLD